jgi:hypothetical protein
MYNVKRLMLQEQRVWVPDEAVRKERYRQSVAVFAIPDDACVVTCLDGSGKYEPISSLDYMTYRLSKAY